MLSFPKIVNNSQTTLPSTTKLNFYRPRLFFSSLESQPQFGLGSRPLHRRYRRRRRRRLKMTFLASQKSAPVFGKLDVRGPGQFQSELSKFKSNYLFHQDSLRLDLIGLVSPS